MASELMSNELALLAIFILSVFVGFEVVSKVSTTLHTPLMSGANAIHGVILVGAIVVANHACHHNCANQDNSVNGISTTHQWRVQGS